MPDMREGGLGTAACYLTVERLALQAGVESPFWDEASLLMGGCEEPWYKKPLTPRRLRSFLKRYGGSLPDDAGRRGHAASVFSDVMRLHGIPMEDGADDLGALYVRRAESVGMTVAFLATGCTLADMAAITGVCEEEDEWTCGCGHDLLNLTACSSPVEIAEAVALMETVKNDALREPDAIHRPTLAEEAANARAAAAALAEEEARCEDDDDDGAPDIIKELFCELFRDDDCEGCPLHREGGGTTDSDELPGDGDLRMFMVSATPFPVWVRGEGWVDAAFALRGEIEDIAVAGFTAALKEGSVHLSAVPVSGDEDAPGMVMLEKVVRD